MTDGLTDRGTGLTALQTLTARQTCHRKRPKNRKAGKQTRSHVGRLYSRRADKMAADLKKTRHLRHSADRITPNDLQ